MSTSILIKIRTVKQAQCVQDGGISGGGGGEGRRLR
jgi:hypothetical protein